MDESTNHWSEGSAVFTQNVFSQVVVLSFSVGQTTDDGTGGGGSITRRREGAGTSYELIPRELLLFFTCRGCIAAS